MEVGLAYLVLLFMWPGPVLAITGILVLVLVGSLA